LAGKPADKILLWKPGADIGILLKCILNQWGKKFSPVLGTWVV
jgi:hypothetical protein